MLEAISGWIRALVGAAVFCALALALCPEGRVKRVLRFACGLVAFICGRQRKRRTGSTGLS